MAGTTKGNFIVDLALLDLDRPIADIEAIRAQNPQRHEMEQLSAILYEDLDLNVCAALKEVGEDEFWVRGHMPGDAHHARRGDARSRCTAVELLQPKK